MMTMIEETVQFIREKTDFQPRIGVILGSGLGPLAEQVEVQASFSFNELPHFPAATAISHSGNLLLGHFSQTPVAFLQGRLHLYEGHPMEKVIFPVRVLRQLGCQILIVTNAAGGINPHFQEGDVVLIRDHINFLGQNPLTGPNLDEFGPRFPDMTLAYHSKLQRLAQEAAVNANISLKEGIYLAAAGPSFETPAEIRMFHKWGADMVGMSTVPEVITANHAGMKVLGFSMISNMCNFNFSGNIDGHSVVQVMNANAYKLIRILENVLPKLSEQIEE